MTNRFIDFSEGLFWRWLRHWTLKKVDVEEIKEREQYLWGPG